MLLSSTARLARRIAITAVGFLLIVVGGVLLVAPGPGFLVIALGLLVQALSLLWNHPLSFIAFIGLGGLLVAGGIVLYLFTLVTIPSAGTEDINGNAKAQTPQT